MYDVLKILYSRNKNQAEDNYKISLENEKLAVQGLVTVIGVEVGNENVWAEKIEPNEEWKPGERYHVLPDYFLYIKRKGKVKKWTLEVKTTRFDQFRDGKIIVKAPAVWTCKNEPDKYPNPYVLAATYREFALLPMGSFWNTSPEDVKFGDFVKKCFLLNVDDYEWNSFLVPLEFYGSKKSY